jgi:hypothetical protein
VSRADDEHVEFGFELRERLRHPVKIARIGWVEVVPSVA